MPDHAPTTSTTKRSRAARIAAHELHAQGKTNTGPARAALTRRFEDQVDPDRVLSTEERAKRVEHARKAYMLRLAAASADARRRRAAEAAAS